MNTNDLNALVSDILKDLCGVLQYRLSEVKEPRERLILLYLLSTEMSDVVQREYKRTLAAQAVVDKLNSEEGGEQT